MELTKHSFEVPIYVSRLACHEEIKGRLLEVIGSLAAPRNQAPGSEISKTSYGLPAINKQWRPIFFQAARDHLNELYTQLETPEWGVHLAWFQTYITGDNHDVHDHGGCAWANVYYLDLPGPMFATEVVMRLGRSCASRAAFLPCARASS